MEKDHFEILLEEMRSNFQLVFEGLDGVNGRLDSIASWQTTVENRLEAIDRLEAGLQVVMSDVRVTNQRFDGLESGFERLESGQEVIKSDVRDIKRNMGLLNSIANDHESRLQGVESKLKDHLENHS